MGGTGWKKESEEYDRLARHCAASDIALSSCYSSSNVGKLVFTLNRLRAVNHRPKMRREGRERSFIENDYVRRGRASLLPSSL